MQRKVSKAKGCTMSEQQVASQKQNPKSVWTRLGSSIIAILAGLWHFIFWAWNILIAGAIAGILGNAAFTLLTAGKVDLAGTLTVITWLYTHLALCIAIVTPILILTLCSFLAHHGKQRAAQENQRIHDESLVVVAKGVQRALDELNAKPSATPLIPSSVNQESTSPKAIWNVPYRRNPFFTGRETLIKQLHDQLTTTKTAALTQSQAISGLGGIGKTQIAIEYAYRYRNEYQYILWVSAASRDVIIAGFVALAGLLALSEKNEQDQNIIITAVKRWLEQYDKWLLILDNADDLIMIRDFLPIESKGHILLTTRAQAVGPTAQTVEVEKMNLEEGTTLLLRRAKVLKSDASLEEAPEEDENVAKAIVMAMDGLPLALDQAGAYIEETGCGLSSVKYPIN